MDIKKLVSLTILFLTACTASPLVETPSPAVVSTFIATAIPYPSATLTATPAFIPASLPDGLSVAYIVDDTIWIWKQNHVRLLIERQNISAPLVSDDGQWLIYKQEYPSEGSVSVEEVWAMRTDGSELHCLLSSKDLPALVGEGISLLVDDISWLPGRNELLFNTQEIIEEPPGNRPVFDLYRLDLTGHVTRLADPGQGEDSLSIATLRGVVTEITSTPPNLCPRADFGLSN